METLDLEKAVDLLTRDLERAINSSDKNIHVIFSTCYEDQVNVRIHGDDLAKFGDMVLTIIESLFRKTPVLGLVFIKALEKGYVDYLKSLGGGKNTGTR